MISEKRPLRVKEFSQKYNVHPNIIYSHIHDGSLPAHKIAGVIMIFEDEVIEATRIRKERDST